MMKKRAAGERPLSFQRKQRLPLFAITDLFSLLIYVFSAFMCQFTAILSFLANKNATKSAIFSVFAEWYPV
jgi:hypothetical protein